MKFLIKFVFLISLIIFSSCITDCSTLNQAQCEESDECTYTSAVPASCSGTGCDLNSASTGCQTSSGCNLVSPTNTPTCSTGCSLNGASNGCVTSEGCSFTAGPPPSCDGEGCALNGSSDGCLTSEGCTFDDGRTAKCTGDGCTLSDDSNACYKTTGCEFIAAISAGCKAKTSSTTFTTTTINLSSVSNKNVIITITPVTAEKNYKTTAKANINGLSLTDDSSFTESLTCEIASQSTLSSVTCSMNKAATDGTKYKLTGSATITSTGSDTFGTVTVDNTQVTAATQSNNNNNPDDDNSFQLKSSLLILLFLILY
jgi:hypothetical protein